MSPGGAEAELDNDRDKGDEGSPESFHGVKTTERGGVGN